MYNDKINEIIDAGKKLYNKSYVAFNDGNISTRINSNQILITCSGISKGFIQEEDIILIDLDGRIISGSKKPSSEYKMHLEIYKNRPDVNGIVHAHPPKATAFAVAGIPIDYVSLPEVVLSLGTIAFTSYGTPTTDELPRNVVKEIATNDVLLLQSHGAVSVGKTVTDAYYKMETLEHFCSISLYARMLGGEKKFDKEETNKLFKIRKEVYGKEMPGCTNCGMCNRAECKQAKPAGAPLLSENNKLDLAKVKENELKAQISEMVRLTVLKAINN